VALMRRIRTTSIGEVNCVRRVQQVGIIKSQWTNTVSAASGATRHWGSWTPTTRQGGAGVRLLAWVVGIATTGKFANRALVL